MRTRVQSPKPSHKSQAWWTMPVTPVLERRRQGDLWGLLAMPTQSQANERVYEEKVGGALGMKLIWTCGLLTHSHTHTGRGEDEDRQRGTETDRQRQMGRQIDTERDTKTQIRGLMSSKGQSLWAQSQSKPDADPDQR